MLPWLLIGLGCTPPVIPGAPPEDRIAFSAAGGRLDSGSSSRLARGSAGSRAAAAKAFDRTSIATRRF